MSNSKLYQPPPAPPKPRVAAVDPLMALSVKTPPPPAPPPAEELVDLTDDDGLEEWAKGGTRIIPKAALETPSLSQPQAMPQTMMQQPSFHPMAYSAPPPAMPKKSSAAIWVIPLALFVLAAGAVLAAGGWYVVHVRDSVASAVAETATVTVTETAPPPVTLATTSTATATVTATAPAPTVTSTTLTSTSSRRVAASATTTTTTTTSGTGTVRTFAAGNGKPVYVDGKQVGYGGGKIATVCGRHLVAVGSGHAKSTEIPCNGTTITVGSPDGM